jgi:2-oxoglutarate ferredoxin oxidoreductase subunit beta
VEHGQPLIFGAQKNRGLRLRPGKLELEVVTLGGAGVTLGDVLVHDETNRALATLLVTLEPPAFPVALGVLYCSPVPSFEAEVRAQIDAADAARRGRGAPDLAELLLGAEGTWTVS